jgi:hypothetical protein
LLIGSCGTWTGWVNLSALTPNSGTITTVIQEEATRCGEQKRDTNAYWRTG